MLQTSEIGTGARSMVASRARAQGFHRSSRVNIIRDMPAHDPAADAKGPHVQRLDDQLDEQRAIRTASASTLSARSSDRRLSSAANA
jgi:hypothetical protein